MNIERTWWFLIEDAEFSEERTQRLIFKNGVVRDGRTDEKQGTFEVEGDRLAIRLGRSEILAKLDGARPTRISATMISGKGKNAMYLPVALRAVE